MGHADGVCSIFVDESADVALAANVVADSKAQMPAACNAAEVLLVHRSALASHLPAIGAALAAAGVTILADDECLPFLPASHARRATDDDWFVEFLSLTIACRSVASLDEAISLIATRGSGHTDCILTQDESNKRAFL